MKSLIKAKYTRISTLTAASCALLAASPLQASYKETMQALAVEKADFAVYVDLRSDFDTLGSLLTLVYTEVQRADPQISPLPIDFSSLFNALGLSQLEALGMVSKSLHPEPLYLNETLLRLEGTPGGIFSWYGSEPQPFTIANSVSANEDLVFEITVDTEALLQTVRAVAIRAMGPLGQGLIDGQLQQPIGETGLTFGKAIARLSGRYAGVFSIYTQADSTPAFSAVVRLSGGNTLLRQIAPFLSNMIPPTTQDNLLIFDLSLLNPQSPTPWLLIGDETNGNLYLASSQKDLLRLSVDQNRLSDDPAFQQMAAKLPETAIGFSYTSRGYREKQIDSILEQLPTDNPYAPLLQTLRNRMHRFLGPAMGAMTFSDLGLHQYEIAPNSFKHSISLAAVAFPALFAYGFAQEMEQNTQLISRQDEVYHNLRTIAAAGQMHLLEQGSTSISYLELVQDGYYLDPVTTVAGESYDDIIISIDTTSISVVLDDGTVVEYAF